MSADEDRGGAGVSLDRLDDLAFRASHIRDEHAGRRRQGGADDISSYAIHGCADDDEIGNGNGGVEVRGAAIDRAQSNGLFE